MASARDRFAELEQFPGRPTEEVESTTIDLGDDEIDGFFKQIDDIRENINSINQKVEETKKKYQTISAATSTDEEDRVKAELDEQQADIKKYANKVRSRLKQIQTQIEQEEQAQRQQAEDEQMLPNTADEKTTEIRMKKTQHSAMSRKFINVMSRYGQAQNEFRDACKEKMRRQIEIMGENVDDAKLEDMLSSGETAPLFAGGIVMDTQKSKQVLDDIQSRKNDILALEKSIKELHDLFVDMAMLVQEQGEMIDRVEYNIEHSVEFVSRAVADTKKAVAFQSAARKVGTCHPCSMLSSSLYFMFSSCMLSSYMFVP